MPRDATCSPISRAYYNRQRIHSAIGYITPEQAEAISA
jgi:transposase InsO family protein